MKPSSAFYMAIFNIEFDAISALPDLAQRTKSRIALIARFDELQIPQRLWQGGNPPSPKC
jgi:hypothetical protein